MPPLPDPYLGGRTFMREVLDALSPRGAAWRPAPRGDMDRLLDGVGDNYQMVMDGLSDLAHLRDPMSTPLLEDLEREYGLSPNSQLTEAQRRALLRLVKYSRNKRATDESLQEALDRAGFGAGGLGLHVYPNDPAVDPGVFSTERSFLTYCGGPNAYCGYFSAGLPPGEWKAVAWNGLILCAVGTNVCASSADGESWTSEPGLPKGDWTAVAWNGAVFCAVAADGKAATSPDGSAWTLQALPGEWTAVTWAPALGLFVAVARGGANLCASSPTGAVWTARPGLPVGRWNAVAWSPNLSLLVAVADNTDGAGAALASSPDGSAWTARGDPIGHHDRTCITWSPERGIFLVGSNNASRTISSVDGTTWILHYGFDKTRGLIWDSVTSQFIAVRQSSFGCYVSPDGANWAYRPIPTGQWQAVLRGPSLVALGYGPSYCATSVDGAASWASQGGVSAACGLTGSGGLWIVNGDAYTTRPLYWGCGYQTMLCGYTENGVDITATCGVHNTFETALAVTDSPVDPTTWPCVFFLAAEAVRDEGGRIISLAKASIPSPMWGNLIEIVLRWKPLHAWALLVAEKH